MKKKNARPDIPLTEEEKKAKEEKIRKYKKRLKKARIAFVQKILIMAAIAFLLMTFVFGVTVVKGNDMSPALRDGDIVVYLKIGQEYGNTSIVIFEKDGKEYISRVAGTQGSTIGKTQSGMLTIDERVHPPLPSEGLFYDTQAGKVLKYPIMLQQGELWLLGDNRPAAVDSRELGPISTKDVKGRLFTVIRGGSL